MSKKHAVLLKEIIAKKSFEGLDEFKNLKIFKEMHRDDCELLSQLLVQRGYKLLQEGKDVFIDDFNWAVKASPSPEHLLYKQAKLCFENDDLDGYVANLLVAADKLVEATTLNEDYGLAWLLWGDVLVALGNECHDVNYFEEAESKYSKASSLLEEDFSLQQRVLWHWGRCYYYLGRCSGEVADVQRALEKYQLVADSDFEDSAFYNDYGMAWFYVGELVDVKKAWWRAAECFGRSFYIDKDYVTGMLNYANVQSLQYQYTGKEYYFNEANKIFDQASQQDFDDATLWEKWGQLLLYVGRRNDDIEVLSAAVDILTKAGRCIDNDPKVWVILGEAMILLGALTEEIELIREGETKIASAVDFLPDDVEVCISCGRSMMAMGKYFLDVDYYEEALEQFREALTIDDDSHQAWRGVADVSVILGEIYRDIDLLSKAVKEYHKAVPVGMEDHQIFNKWGEAYLKLAEISNDQLDVEAAIGKFEHALYLEEDARTLYNYGCALDFLGDFYESSEYYQKAVQALTKALNLDLLCDDAHYNLALSLSHLGEITGEVEHLHEAIDHFQKLISKDPEDEQTWNDYGVTLITLSQMLLDPTIREEDPYLEEAAHKLMRAASLGNGQAFYHLACLYSLSGDYSEAWNYMERAVEYNALPPVEDIQQDIWLEGLRETERYKIFISNLE